MESLASVKGIYATLEEYVIIFRNTWLFNDLENWREKAIDFAHQANQLLDYSIFHHQINISIMKEISHKPPCKMKGADSLRWTNLLTFG